MLLRNESCSDSLSECGSIDSGSPWFANLKVAAPASETKPGTAAADATAKNVAARSFLMFMGILEEEGEKGREVRS